MIIDKPAFKKSASKGGRSSRVGEAFHVHYDDNELNQYPKIKKCCVCQGSMERIGIMYCCMNPKCNRVIEIGATAKAYASGITRNPTEKE